MINNKYLLLAAIGFMFFPLQGQAEDKIIVIQEDGSKAEFILDQAVPAPKPENTETLKNSQSVPSMKDLMTEPEKPVAQPVKTSPPKPTAVKPKVKSAAKAAPQKKVVLIPYPPHKPNREEINQALQLQKSIPVVKRVDPKNIPPGTAITKDLAVRVALEVSPPSRGFQVYTTTYESRPAYQVRFKTDSGPHDVVVDADTGKVLKK